MFDFTFLTRVFTPVYIRSSLQTSYVEMKWKLRAAEKDKKALKEEKEILEKVGGSVSFFIFENW